MDSYNNKNSYDEFEDKASNIENEGEGQSKKLSKEKIILLLKKPKNIFIFIGTLVFIILISIRFVTSKPQKNSGNSPVDENRIPLAATDSPVSASLPPDLPHPPAVSPSVTPPPVAAPPLPTLDVTLFDNLKSSNVSTEPEGLDSIDIKKLREELSASAKTDSQPDLNSTPIPEAQAEAPVVAKIRKIDANNPPPPLLIDTKVPAFPPKKLGDGRDFIFVDSAFTAEVSTDIPIKAKRMRNLGNMIVQGRKVDVILETAIDSSIPGTVRGIVSKDVYAEAGRSVLIPKGTRLYGIYNVGGGKTGRVTIAWTRIFRPDGVAVDINGQAADQFGRAGIAGNVDKKYGEIIVSALLLASIPLVATIASEQITGGSDRPRGATFTQNGVTITTTDDPINVATDKFTTEVANATQQVVQNLIDTTLVVSIPQGTKVSLFVNQDIELPEYNVDFTNHSSITRASSAAY